MSLNATDDEWATLFAISRQNKIDGFFAGLTDRLGRGARTAELAVATSRRIASDNAKVLQYIKIGSEALSSRGIGHIFYKGPLQQKILYGNFFAKRSADADVLVSRADFKAAGEALRQVGFFTPLECQSIWWWRYLGEQHYFQLASNHVSLDLHHKLQIPGCPSPADLSRFLKSSEIVSLGSLQLRTLGRPFIALIAALNLVKGLYHRHPCGNHALDLLVCLHQMSKGDLENCLQEAKRQNLGPTLFFATRVAAIAAGSEDPISKSSMKMPIDHQLVQDWILTPNDLQVANPRKIGMLWRLCEKDLSILTGEWVEWLESEFVRKFRKSIRLTRNALRI